MAAANYFGHRFGPIWYKRLRNIGSDLGGAFKGFKSAMKDEKKDESEKLEKVDEKVIDGEAVREENKDNTK